MTFRKATKEKSKLRLALIGPTGTGKTYSALGIAQGLGSKIAVIDTERGSASKYAGIFNFDVLELESYSVEQYMAAINEAVRAGYDVLVIDSLSHAWAGKDGILEYVDKKGAANPGGNNFANWRSATPLHNKFVDTILAAPIHVIATMRSKTEWIVEKDERGKATPRKIGLAPVQRDGVEYEFDVIGDMTAEHRLIISKSRIPGIADDVLDKPGAELGQRLRDWLEDGVEIAPRPAAEAKPEMTLGHFDYVTLDEARAFIVPGVKGELAGKPLGEYPLSTLGQILDSDKASERLKAMAALVLEQKELGGEGIPA